MKISREARRTARELYKLSLVGGHIDQARVAEISDRLVASKPRSYVPILKEFSRLLRLELERRHAIIESATALDATSAASVEQNLKTKFGTDITTEFRVNPALIAGLRIKFGSDVLDGSVSARLEALQKQL